MKKNSYLTIDWGTSNFRAFLIGDDGGCLDQIEKPMGLLSVPDGQFSQVLSKILQEWLGKYQSYPIYMAGMVGSANGWLDSGYVATPASKQSLATHKQGVKLPWNAEAYIIPGVSHQSSNQSYDVMRGEEVQIFGLINKINAPDCYAILPGTHSKHVKVSNYIIEGFSSYMTGEVYSILTQHSILGKSLPQQEINLDAFVLGIKQGANNQSLLTNIFMARTQKLFKQIQENHIHDYLSGILIGEELSTVQGNVYIVGGDKLSHRYQVGCETLGINSTLVNGDDCFLAGMKKIKELIHE